MHIHLRELALAAVLVLGIVLLPLVAHAATGTQAIVDTAALNVRSGPGTGFAVIDVVHSGDSLPVTGQNSSAGWYQVSLADGRTGWVSGALVSLSGDTSSIPVAAAGTAAAGTTAASGSGSRGGTIVFQLSSGGAIYAVNPDGSGLRYLTAGMDPAVSPDGKQVAFTRWQGQSTGVAGSLWVINVDGTGERQVAAGANQAKSPSWSADGKQIVIGLQQGGRLDTTWICIVDGVEVEVAQPIEGQRCVPLRADPAWGLRVVDVATGSYEDLPDARHSFAPTWDPANSWHVVFRGDLGLYSLDLNQKTMWLIQTGGAQRGPSFSPDGGKISTTYKQNDHWEVHVMNADASGEVRLTETPWTMMIDQQLRGEAARQWNNAAPAWSPDGAQIAFISDRNGLYELWAMNADGSNAHLVVPVSALGGQAIQYEGVDERVISWR